MLRTAAIAGLTLALAANASAAPVKTTSIDVGSAKFFQQTDDSALLAGLQLFLTGGLDRQTSAQNGLAALAAQTVLQSPVGGVPLRDAVAARGGALSYTVGPQYVRFYLEGPPDMLGALTALFDKVITAPATDALTIAAARAELNDRIADQERNPVAVGSAMLRQSFYDGSAGLPTYGTTATLPLLTGNDVRGFIGTHYRRGGAIVTAVGRVTGDVTLAGKTLASTLPDGTDGPVETKMHAFAPAPKRIVTQRDIGVPYVMLGFAAPSVGDKDFGAMLILRSLLSDVFDRQSATTLPAYARTVGVLYNYETKPASFSLYINGSQIDPTAGLGSVDEVLKDIAGKPLTPVLLKRYKASAHGEWQTESVSLADRAWSIGTYVEQGIDPDYDATALAAVDAATAADVTRVAKAYLQKYTVALIVPRDKTQPNG